MSVNLHTLHWYMWVLLLAWYPRITSTALFSINSLCLPSDNQLQLNSQLDSTTAINGLGGNTFYYAIRAMEAHYNRNVSTTTAAEDNAAIASVSE